MSTTPMHRQGRRVSSPTSSRPSPRISTSRRARRLPIRTIAAACGLSEEDYEPYGHFKAKLSEKIGPKFAERKAGSTSCGHQPHASRGR